MKRERRGQGNLVCYFFAPKSSFEVRCRGARKLMVLCRSLVTAFDVGDLLGDSRYHVFLLLGKMGIV